MDEQERRVKFGRKLRQLRKEKKLSAEELGERFGLSKTTIWGYEQGYRLPDMETITRFAEFFNVSVDYLVGNDAILNQTNAREILSRRDLTWDGIPLGEEELKQVRDFLSFIIREKIPKWEEKQKKRTIANV